MADNGFSERRDAEALQRAWERYERLLAKGTSAEDAAREASRLLTPGAAPLFTLGDAVRVSARPPEMPAFAVRMEADLMALHSRVRPLAPARARRTAGSTIMAFAACVAVVAGVLIGSSHSLPGDALYSLKRASEEAQLAIIWGPTEANVRLDIAETRLGEVQGLYARARTQVLGVPGTNVAGVLDNMDPEIAQLIRDTLAEAEHQITIAAKILMRERGDSKSLKRLAAVATQGAAIAKGVAVTLPSRDKPPVLTTADNLATVAAAAEAVSQDTRPATRATASPCPTPTPTPTPSPTPSGTPDASATPTPSPTAAASPQPAGPTNCVTPPPSPSPEPTPTPIPAATPKASPDSENSAGASPAAQPDSSSEGDSDGQRSDATANRPQPAS